MDEPPALQPELLLPTFTHATILRELPLHDVHANDAQSLLRLMESVRPERVPESFNLRWMMMKPTCSAECRARRLTLSCIAVSTDIGGFIIIQARRSSAGVLPSLVRILFGFMQGCCWESLLHRALESLSRLRVKLPSTQI